jgi:hypothetical protein
MGGVSCNNLILLKIITILLKNFPLNKHAGFSLCGAIVDYMVLSISLCKIFISQFLKEWQILTHFSDRV